MLLAGILASGVPATRIIENGPVSNRIDVVYIAEGYTLAELGDFAPTVAKAIQYKDTASIGQPYKRYRKFFNYYRIDLPSDESGIDEPEKGVFRNTALDATGSGNLGEINQAKAKAAAIDGMQAIGINRVDWIYVVLNTPLYYNSGGEACAFSTPNYGEIALHEGGHSFHDLADEYQGPGTYAGSEAREINVSKDPAAGKWAHWIGYQQPWVGRIGAYEGARYFEKGIFRPSLNSKMNLTGQSSPQGFNMPSIEKIIRDIYVLVRPLDDYPDNSEPVKDPERLWVKTVDPEVLLVDWSVDGQVVARNGGESFSMARYPLVMGTHTVRAHVYDEVVIHARSDNAAPHPLDLVRTGLDMLQQDVEWTVDVTRPIAIRNAQARPRSAFALLEQLRGIDVLGRARAKGFRRAASPPRGSRPIAVDDRSKPPAGHPGY